MLAGSREDLSSASDAYKVESADNSNDPHFNYSDSHFEKYMHPYGPGLKSEANHDVQTHHDSKFSVEGIAHYTHIFIAETYSMNSILHALQRSYDLTECDN